jgi:PhoPQ-activated pathogenicity-related protein
MSFWIITRQEGSRAVKSSWALLGTLLVCISQGHAFEPPPAKTALDEYIAREDTTYSWKLVNTTHGAGYTAFFVDLKSQSWRSKGEVNQVVWEHSLIIVKPDVVKHDTAFLTIGGGRTGKRPDRAGDRAILFAKETNTVVAELGMVPNEPLIFNGDGKPRVEDDLIAYCWIKYMDTGDATWIPRLPMVKSAVRAMDAVNELLASKEGGQTALKKWVVAGGSKRGWTTWLTAAADKRVVAIVPIVIDVLNVPACSMHHFRSYGFWAPAIGDYIGHKVQDRANTPQYAELLKIDDPYSYRARLTLPKFIVNSAGDQYFPPDSSQFYFDDLKGPKYLRYVPNTDHSLGGSDAVQSILAFYQAVLNGKELPRFSWKMEADGGIRVQCQDRPAEVYVWQANNPKARDFRLESIGKAYQKSPLVAEKDGSWVARVDKPENGWTAFFVEMVFSNGDKLPYKFTTPVRIVPDVLPYRMPELGHPTKPK